MTAMKSDRPGEADKAGAEKSGPEKYAPPERRSPEKLGDVDQAAANAFEGEIREFVRRDVAFSRRPRNEADTQPEPVADNLNALIRRVSNASMDEIDRVIGELQGVREMLHAEGERVNREIAGYASLSHLRRFPLDVLKIDRSFIADLAETPDAAIVRSLIELGHRLKLRVVAEGVETEQQLAALRRLGCARAPLDCRRDPRVHRRRNGREQRDDRHVSNGAPWCGPRCADCSDARGMHEAGRRQPLAAASRSCGDRGHDG